MTLKNAVGAHEHSSETAETEYRKVLVRWSKARSRTLILSKSGVLPGAEKFHKNVQTLTHQVHRRPKCALLSAAGRRTAAAAHSAKVASVSTIRAARPGMRTHAGKLARAALEARATSQWALLDTAAAAGDYQDSLSRIQAKKAGHAQTRAILDGQLAEKAVCKDVLDAEKRREKDAVIAAMSVAAAGDTAAAAAKLAGVQALKADREAQVLEVKRVKRQAAMRAKAQDLRDVQEIRLALAAEKVTARRQALEERQVAEHALLVDRENVRAKRDADTQQARDDVEMSQQHQAMLATQEASRTAALAAIVARSAAISVQIGQQGIEVGKRKMAEEDARLVQYEKQQVMKEAVAVAEKKAKAALAKSALLESHELQGACKQQREAESAAELAAHVAGMKLAEAKAATSEAARAAIGKQRANDLARELKVQMEKREGMKVIEAAIMVGSERQINTKLVRRAEETMHKYCS